MILSFIPNIVFHLIVIAGILGIVASFFLTFIPFVNLYKLPIQIASIILLVFGIYFEGAINTQAVWEQKVAAMEVWVARQEAESADANTKIVELIAKNEKLILEKDNATDKIITKYITKYDNRCDLPNATISVHNSASQNIIPKSPSNSN